MDREKVIKALEDFNKNRICLPHLIPWDEIADALALLKEQEPVKPYRNKLYKTWHCGNCDGAICSSRSKFNNYCRNCGRKVKWDA